MRIHAFEAPYDSGRFQERMGCGPSALLKAGLVNRLRFLGHEVTIERIRIADEFPCEIKSTFRLANELSARISSARATSGLSVVLSGNCNAAIGTLSALDPERTGVLWFDAHGEFNTPEITRSGFLDGMGLAIATGHCWRRLAESVHNFSRLPPKNVVLLGVRDVDAEEQDLLDRAGVQQIPADAIRERGIRSLLAPVLQPLNRRIDAVYVHFDLDSLDPSVARWNQWTPSAGLSLEHVEAGLDLLAGGPPITAIGFASHDPQVDPDNSFEAARRLFDRALAVAGA